MIGRLIERTARRVARRGMLAARAGFLRMTHASGLAEREIDPSKVERILAVRLDRLGDLVLTLPAIDDLAVAYPNAHRVMMVPPAHAPLLRASRVYLPSYPIVRAVRAARAQGRAARSPL